MTTTRFSEPARPSTPANRWSATWFLSGHCCLRSSQQTGQRQVYLYLLLTETLFQTRTLYVLIFNFLFLVSEFFINNWFTIPNTCSITASWRKSSLPWDMKIILTCCFHVILPNVQFMSLVNLNHAIVMSCHFKSIVLVMSCHWQRILSHFKDGAYYYYCAYGLRISRYRDIFARLKTMRKKQNLASALGIQKEKWG